VRTAYEQLYSHYEDAIENTADPALLTSLLASQDAVAKVISLDNEAIIQQNSDAFAAVLKQMNATNKGLSDLQDQIKKVAGNINTFAGILSGINEVFSLVPGI